MRWFNFITLLIYISVLMASPVKAVVASKVDVLYSGAVSQKALIAFSHEIPLTEKNHSSDDKPAYLPQLLLPKTVAITVEPVELPQFFFVLAKTHQARAPPLS